MMIILGLILKIEGAAHCKWPESSGHKYHTSYTDNEKYFESTSYLINSLESKNSLVLGFKVLFILRKFGSTEDLKSQFPL